MNIDRCHGGYIMTESKEIRELTLRIAGIIIEELKLEEITPEKFDPDMDLVDELGVDSMDLATVALVLQDEYGVFIDEDDYPKLKSTRLIAEYLQSRLQGAKV
jgi:acyl carrier protein